MSPDPFIQAPFNSQSYNRYSYVFNNPLSYTDPSGKLTCSEGEGMKVCTRDSGSFPNLTTISLMGFLGAAESVSNALDNNLLGQAYDAAGLLGVVVVFNTLGVDGLGSVAAEEASSDDEKTDEEKKKENADKVNEGLNPPPEGKRRKNRISDEGEPGTVAENPSGTTRKKYRPDGSVEKEWNKGHGPNHPRGEQQDHIHDHKPNPNNPSGRGDRMPGREPRPRDLNDMDFY